MRREKLINTAEILTNIPVTCGNGPTQRKLAPLSHWKKMRASEHFVQFYDEDEFFVESVCAFIGAGLGAGEGAIIIATEAHRTAFEERLTSQGINLPAVRACGQYVALDASKTLSQFMMDGMPDEERFYETIGSVVAQMVEGRRGLRAFGEMVALLWKNENRDAVIHLEKLWNDLGKKHCFSLFCAYPMSSFDAASHGETFVHICNGHTRVIPAESYAAISRTDDKRLRSIALLQQKAALEAEVTERKRVERSANHLAAIIESSEDAIISKDLNGVIQSWNAGAERLFGYTAEEVIGQPVTLFIPADRRNEEVEILSRIRRGQRVDHFETVRRRKDGSLVDISLTISPIRDATGCITGASKIARDITDRKRAEKELRAGEERIRQLLSLMPAAVYTCDAGGRITFFNRRASELWGREPAVGEDDDKYCGSFRLWQADGSPLPHEATPMAHALKTGESARNREVTIERPDGSRITVSVNIDPLYDRDGRPCGAINVFQEITKAKIAEDRIRILNSQLRHRLEEFETLIKTAPIGIAVAGDPECKQIWGNPAFERMLGAEGNISKSALHGVRLPFRTLREGQEVSAEDLPMQRACRLRQEINDEELEIARADGSVINELAFAAPLYDENGNVRGCVGAFLDITERKRTEMQMTALKDQLALELADMKRLHQLSTRLLREGNLIPLLQEVLQASVELTGTTQGNLQLFDEQKNALKIVAHTGFSQEFLEEFKSVPAGHSVCGNALQNCERVIVEDASADPQFAHLAPIYARHGFVAVQSTPLIGSDGRILGVLSTHFPKPHRPSERELQLLDLFALQAVRVIERKRAEEIRQRLFELVAAVNRAGALSEIYDAALDAICHCHNANRASVLLFDDAGVMRFSAWRGLSDGYRRAVEGHSPWQRDDANPQPVCMDDVAAVDLEAHLREVIGKEGIRSLAFIPITNDKRLLGKFMIYYDAPHHFTPEELGLARTIASQIAFAVERHKSGEALERLVQERTASLREAVAQMEEFSYSVSHDLRAPVRAMHGFARILAQEYDGLSDDECKDYLGRIVRGGERMDNLIRDILIYSRVARAELELHPVLLDKLVTETIQLYPAMQSPRAEIEVAKPLATVIGHEPSLMQAVSNLLANAVKFVPPDTTPRVRVWTERNGRTARLFVRDNGIGIKRDHQARIFGMFERIHPEKKYEGTGIGLAIVRKAVERMGGVVGVESDGDSGSTFWIELPLKSGNPASPN